MMTRPETLPSSETFCRVATSKVANSIPSPSPSVSKSSSSVVPKKAAFSTRAVPVEVPVSFTSKPRVGFTGTHSLRYDGSHLADGEAYATNVLYDDVDVVVGEDSRLSWKIFPELLDDLQYPSTYAAVDLEFTDGTFLSDLAAPDARAKKEDADKRGGVKDAGGTTWWIATRLE